MSFLTTRYRRFLKITIAVLAVLVVAVAGLYILIVVNASSALERMVHNKSNGTMALDVTGLRFNIFTDMLTVRKAVLYSTDSVSQPVTYTATVPGLSVRVSSIWNMLVYRQLLLDSIKLNDPMVDVVRRRRVQTPAEAADARSDTSGIDLVEDDGLSIAQEIGNVYNSMLDGLESFGINRIRMYNAGFRLTDLTRPGLPPTFVNRIDLELIRTANGPFKRDAYIEDEQSIDVQIRNQDIHMPNGRHRLSFSGFHLELFSQRVVLDSCTLTAAAVDSAKSSYTIFFDSLVLVGVDFGAMYRSNVLRADSVYCTSPVFDIKLDNSNAPVEVPDPAKLIREFTSDLDMRYLAVRDADIRLDITGRKNRAQVNSNADNFEIYGLRVFADSTNPVSVDQFDLRVSDYKLYNRDSTTVYAFDSVHFHNSTIALSNFSVITTSHPLRPRNERSFAIPHFALMGMDWYQLIFDQNLRAREAVLYHPDIKYTRKLPAAASSQVSMLSSLHTLDSLLTLDRITIVNGRVNVALGNGESFSFEDVSLLVNSNRVLAASGVTELRDAVQNLSFLGGRINYANTTTVLENVKSKNGIIQAGNVLVTSSDGSVEAEISDVVIGNVTLDNKTGSAAVDGVRWTDADVKLKTASGGGNGGAIGDNTSLLTLRNVSGDNTAFALITDGAVMSTMVKTLRVASLEKNGNRPFRVEGLLVDGNALKVLDTAGLKVEATEYKLDGEASYVKGLTINRFSENDSLTVSVPHVDFYADENAILANRLHLHSLDATAPEIKYAVYATDVEQVVDSLADSLAVAPDIRVGKVMLRGPLVALTFADETNEIDVLLPADSSALIGITELRLDTGGFGAKAVSLNASSFSLASTSGENFGLDSGAINIRLTDVRASDADNKTTWNALVETLDLQKAGGMLQAAKRGTLRLDSVSLAGMRLSSANTADYPLLVRENAGMTVRTVTGSYIDSTTTLNWHNVSYAPSGELKLDSFSYRPSQPRDVVIERSQYETDYVTFRTGAVHFAGLNAGRFARDSALTVSRAFVHQPVITAYRDKAPPFLHGIVKPLPVDMVKRLPFPLHVQRLDVADGLVEYTERHEFSRATGVISLNAMRGTVLNLKNHDLRDTDSLTILLDTRLLDTIGTHVRVRQAYTDTLNSFRLVIEIEPMPFAVLNPAIGPLMNVHIVSGFMDSFRLRAVGREYVSFGETYMFYHDLKIRLLKDGDPKKRSFLKGLLSKYINAFVVKKHNRDRVGLVYFERVRDRSFFNYILKMTVSGMATSVGAKRNEGYLKKYKRTVTRENLPPIDFEITDPSLEVPATPPPQTRNR